MFLRFTFSDRDNMEKLFKQFRKFPKKCMKTIQVMQQNIFFYFVLDFLDLATFQSPLFFRQREKYFFRSQAPIFPVSHWPSGARPMRDRKNQCLGLEKYEKKFWTILFSCGKYWKNEEKKYVAAAGCCPMSVNASISLATK